MTAHPKTRFAKNGDVNIAYQVVGEGDFDLVYVPGWVSHVEEVWREPRFAAGLKRLASFSRLVLIDRSGTGMSDPVVHLPTLEERSEEVRAVMDAAGVERASLLGVSEGGPMCAFFAATYPERTRSLVLLNTYALMRRTEDTPWGMPEEASRKFIEDVEEHWGDGMSAKLFAPSLADDQAFIESWGRMERYSVSRGVARRLLDMAGQLDVRDVLSTIQVPTLVLHRTGDLATPVAGGRYLAEKIPTAQMVEVEGQDHFPFVGDVEPLFREVERFLTGSSAAVEPDRVLATVLFTDIVDSTRRIAELGDRAWGETLERFYALVRDEVGHFRGNEVDTAGDGYLATFDGPARAIRCAQAVREGVKGLGLAVRQGLHTGECEVIGGKLGGLSVHIGARVAGKAEPGEILVSRTVKDLVVGSSLRFTPRGDRHELKGVPGEWQLYAAE
ncbi:MAG: adenylate/guanylate cyclase domain-containing protein [Myxococcota bacterium]